MISFFISGQFPAFGQSGDWQFISKNSNGSTSYLNFSGKNQPKSSNQQTWTKEVFSDGSYKITLVNWKCREKRFQIQEAVNYASSGAYVDREDQSSWTTIIPDSVAENYFKVVCATGRNASNSNSVSRKIFVQVIVENANIREAPFAVGTVMQTVEKGARLALADPEPVGVWYQVLIPETDEKGWLHGSTIKIIKAAENGSQTERKSRTLKKRSARRIS